MGNIIIIIIGIIACGYMISTLLFRKIEDEVESLLSEKIIAGELKKGDIPVVKYANKKLKLI